ncbi:MAG: hypothetical protein CL583_14715 [Alteromonadaceae bacterium]|nr:hypothetical protein [Alteromonadaceae bacterium]|tara:strand:+ start:1148 stop:1531 length:384 start_codon:yes stop_codon:yes gene_type:complete
MENFVSQPKSWNPMPYRLLVLILALVLVLLLLLGFWVTSRLFLQRYGAAEERQAQIMRLTAWTFAGFGVGLVVVGVGGPVLGALAFTYTARNLTEVSWPVTLLWGATANGIVALIIGGALTALVLNQ